MELSSKRAKVDEDTADPRSRLNLVFQSYPVDNLYHLGLDTAGPLQEIFGGITTVCMMGSPGRAAAFAKVLSASQGCEAPVNLAKTDRCNMFKVGKVISMSHGMGCPSMLIFAHEVTKLLFHAKADLTKVRLIRLGTSGGVGVAGGTVVLTDQGMDATLELGYEHVALGRKTREPAVADAMLTEEIIAANRTVDEPLGFDLVKGTTICTDDYYDAQGRMDGALPLWYTEEEKNRIFEESVRSRRAQHGDGGHGISMDLSKVGHTRSYPCRCAFEPPRRRSTLTLA